MKKRDLTALALLGISTALCVGATDDAKNEKKNELAQYKNSNTQQRGSRENRDPFYDSLSPDAQRKYDELDPEHKSKAKQMMQHGCKGKNMCQHLGGCKTDQHDCVGQNDCKGQGGGAVTDPNKAVDAQYNNQMQHRSRIGAQLQTTSTTAKTTVQ